VADTCYFVVQDLLQVLRICVAALGNEFTITIGKIGLLSTTGSSLSDTKNVPNNDSSLHGVQIA
jgi:hypothetical protein